MTTLITTIQLKYILLKKALNIRIKRRVRKVNFFLTRATGYTFSNYSDAFSVATLLLIIIKFIFRLFFFNLNWQINLTILFLLTIICLQLNTAITVRKGFKWFWRKALPSSFYYRNTFKKVNVYEDEETFIYEEQPFLYKCGLTVFFFFVYIRLWILTEPFIFLLFNYIFIYFLLINTYLITSSFIGLFFAVSRWTFFLEDKTISEFNYSFSGLEHISEGQTLYPSWENAETVGIFITRYLSKDAEEMISKFSKEGKYEHETSAIGGFIDYYMIKRYIGLNHPIIEKAKFITYTYTGFLENDENKPAYTEFDFSPYGVVIYSARECRTRDTKRFFWHDNDELYIHLINSIYKLKKKNSFFFSVLGILFSILIGLGIFFLFSGTCDILQAVPKTIVTSAAIITADENLPQIRKTLKVVRIPENESAFVSEKLTKSSAVFSPKAKGHPVIAQQCADNTIHFNTLSHIRSGRKDTELLKAAVEEKKEFPIKGLVTNTKNHEIKDKEFAEEVFGKYPVPTDGVLKVLNTELTFVQSSRIVKVFRGKINFQEHFTFDSLVNPLPSVFRVEHKYIIQLRKISLDSASSYTDALTAADLTYKYYSTMVEHPRLLLSQYNEYILSAARAKKHYDFLVTYGPKNSEYQTTDNIYFRELFKKVEGIITLAKKEIRSEPFETQCNYISENENKEKVGRIG